MLQIFHLIAFRDDYALWFRLAPNYVNEERRLQVLDVVFQGEESCRQHVHSIRLDNVRHTESDARRAEQYLLSAQENLRRDVESVRESKERLSKEMEDGKVWSTFEVDIYRSANELKLMTEVFVRRCEERARHARQVARLAVEALGSPSVAV